jgi:hypothetical protein
VKLIDDFSLRASSIVYGKPFPYQEDDIFMACQFRNASAMQELALPDNIISTGDRREKPMFHWIYSIGGITIIFALTLEQHQATCSSWPM